MSKANHIAFVCPRFQTGSVAGGAETLLRNHAEAMVAAGRRVTFLTTCAASHHTWTNEIPAGTRSEAGIEVHFFPTDEDRNVPEFLRVQTRICQGATVSDEEEQIWIRNSVHSSALIKHLRDHAADYDVIIAGPYLFGVVVSAAEVCPQKTILVPCLHDEPFAYRNVIRSMFRSVRACMFNSYPEMELAIRLYGLSASASVVAGMGVEKFTADPTAFAAKHCINTPYLIYSGRREPMKGTPLLIDYLRTFHDRNRTDLKLVLTGSGDVEIPPQVRAHVLDAGFVSTGDKRSAMAGALAFCHPSVYESFGIVLMESWMAGTPCLVHARGAVLRDHCERCGGGLWFRHYPDFEEIVLRLMQDKGLRSTLATAGRNYVIQEFEPTKVSQRILEFLDR